MQEGPVTRLTVMMRASEEQQPGEEEGWAQTAQDTVRRHLGIQRSADVCHVAVARRAIPQYVVGHAEVVRQVEHYLRDHLPGVSLAGNSWRGVSVNDCVQHSHDLVDGLRLSPASLASSSIPSL